MSQPLTERHKTLTENRIERIRANSLKAHEPSLQWNSRDFRDVAGRSPIPEHSFKKSIRNLSFWPSSYVNRISKAPNVSYEPEFSYSKNSTLMPTQDYKVVLRSKNQVGKQSLMISKLVRESMVQKHSNFASPGEHPEIAASQRQSLNHNWRPVQDSKYANDTVFKELHNKIVSKIVAKRIVEKSKHNGTVIKPISLSSMQRELENFIGNFKGLANKINPALFDYEKIQKSVRKVLHEPSTEEAPATRRSIANDKNSRRILSSIKPIKCSENLLKFDSAFQDLIACRENIRRLRTEFAIVESDINKCSKAFFASINKQEKRISQSRLFHAESLIQFNRNPTDEAETLLQSHVPIQKSRLGSISDLAKSNKGVNKESLSQQIAEKESLLNSLAQEIDSKRLEHTELVKHVLNLAYEIFKNPEELWLANKEVWHQLL